MDGRLSRFTEPSGVSTLSKFFSQLAEEMKTELAGLALLAVGTVILLGFFTSATGTVGLLLVRACRVVLGEAGLIIPVMIVWFGLQLLLGKQQFSFSYRYGGLIVLIVAGASLWHIVQIPETEEFVRNGWRGLGGGLTGAVTASVLGQLLGSLGRLIFLIALLLVGLMLAANRSLLALFRLMVHRSRLTVLVLWERLRDIFDKETVEPSPTAQRPKDRLGETPKKKTKTERTAKKEEAKKQAAGPTVSKPLMPVSKRQLGLDDEVDYVLPPLSLLEHHAFRHSARSQREALDKARLLEDTLKSFGVTVKVTDVSRGPAVTRFELQPGPGVKVASIVNLTNDLALKLACSDLRIEAPIPGKSALGIEVPNQEISVVHLREVLETAEYRHAASPITVALGKDISGRAIVSQLEGMPHLLIAGATGSGKSVCINSIIASLLFRAHPEQVKLLLIDPKMVELAQYQGIPHLLAPVVTNPKKAAGALRWVLHEMERRYELFVAAGVRDIKRYQALSRESKDEPPPPDLPYIVVIIDELADLMVVAPGEVEDCIFRLAQMARAAGIHLVVATQRPSVDVITGTIKANIPSRIAFAVSSAVDSRTILDVSGAERLVGRGDMLYFPVGTTKPIRAQGAFIAEPEMEALIRFVSEQGQPEYSEAAMQAVEVEDVAVTREEADELFPQAVRMVVEAGQASVSLLQRKLPIGYTRAGRLIDMMEERGFIGPHEGSKPRDLRLTLNEYDRLFGKGQAASSKESES